MLGVLFAEKVGSGSKFRGQALRTTADGIDIGTCIIDLQTDHILYMNQNMKNAFNLQGVEGLPCWQVLRVGQEGRCAKCPIFGLKETLKSSFLCSWEERSVLNGHIYKNFMGLLYWGKNSVVSLLQSVEKMELL